MSCIDSEKKPGAALVRREANSAVVVHSRNVLTASSFSVAAFMPMPMSVWSLMWQVPSADVFGGGKAPSSKSAFSWNPVISHEPVG